MAGVIVAYFAGSLAAAYVLGRLGMSYLVGLVLVWPVLLVVLPIIYLFELGARHR